MISKKEKADILSKVSEGLDIISHGSITITLRGPDRPIDVEITDRTRFELNSKKNKPHKNFDSC